jgi:fluoroacetyl-CoA thioesterase
MAGVDRLEYLNWQELDLRSEYLMKRHPRIGESAEIRFVVGSEHTITFAEPPMPAVLSTPTLIGFMEQTARKALTPLMDDGETNLGVKVDIEHLAGTLPGHEVTCTARVTFQVEARDETDLLSRGVHRRCVVDTARLARRLSRKAL